MSEQKTRPNRWVIVYADLLSYVLLVIFAIVVLQVLIAVHIIGGMPSMWMVAIPAGLFVGWSRLKRERRDAG